MWNETTIHQAVETQRTYFKSGKTLPVAHRILQLKKLKAAILKHEEALEEALFMDLGRSKAEAYFCDIGATILEINETIQGLQRWAKPKTHFSGLLNFPSVFTKVYPMPYGVTLIISPFNFPVLLTLGPLAASLAAGNTAVLKTSSKSVECTKVLGQLIRETFDEKEVLLVDGGHDIADLLLAERFDKIFYTGSPKVAKHILKAASHHLTPVALELGGETGNWCIIRKDADLRDAARKIAFFKILNSGQICININQVAVAAEVAEEFLGYLKQEFIRQIGEKPLENPEYPHLISQGAYEKCALEAEEYKDRILFGGQGNPGTHQYEPTIIYPVKADEPIVQHELFCPLLPVVPYKDQDIDHLLSLIADREHGLALYLFTKDLRWAKKVMGQQQYGGGCINEVCQHLMVRGVPFGGTGHSGMGAYHGEWGFKEFSHYSTVMIGSNHFNLPLREHPYTGKEGDVKMKLIRWFEK